MVLRAIDVFKNFVCHLGVRAKRETQSFSRATRIFESPSASVFELAANLNQAARLRILIPNWLIPRPHADPAHRRSGRYCIVRTSSETLQHMGFLFEGCLIRCGFGSQISKDRQNTYFEVNQSLNEALGGSIYYPSSLDELFPWCHPLVEVASNHSANVCSVLDNFLFTKLLTVC